MKQQSTSTNQVTGDQNKPRFAFLEGNTSARKAKKRNKMKNKYNVKDKKIEKIFNVCAEGGKKSKAM